LGLGSFAWSRQPFDFALQRQNSLLDQRDALAELGGSSTPVLCVDVRRDGLQVLDEQRLETHEGFELLARHVDQPDNRRLIVAVGRNVAIDVIDQRRVETLLGIEWRTDHPPDERSESSFQRAIGR
jgi:hypothetical protein